MVKKVQDVFVGDLNDTLRCTLWEDDIGELVEGKNYCLKRFIVREYELKNYISKGMDSSISETACYIEVPEQEQKLLVFSNWISTRAVYNVKHELSLLTQDLIAAQKKNARCCRSMRYVLCKAIC